MQLISLYPIQLQTCLLSIFCLLFLTVSVIAAPSNLTVDASQKNLIIRHTGEPFLWLGDTAWSAIKELSRSEMDTYLDHRQKQGFTVIQVILIGHDPGSNKSGHHPFSDSWDASRPRTLEGEDDYWDLVDYFINGTISRGMYVCALPLWRKHVFEAPLICKDKTYAYGLFLGDRYREQNANIIWCMGGDMYLDFKNCHDASYDVYHNLAKGLATGALGTEDYSQMCMTYHIWGGNTTATVPQLKEAPWMTFHSIQSGHKENRQEGMLQQSLAAEPQKPIIDLEPMYDDYFGTNTDRTRHINWWGVFEGGFGTTMGSWNVWHFGERDWSDPKSKWKTPESYTTGFATQIQHLGRLLQSRPMLKRRFKPEVLHPDTRYAGKNRIYGNKLTDGSCLMVYSPRGWNFRVNMDHLKGSKAQIWWFNPRNGSHVNGGIVINKGGYFEFDPPGSPGEPFGDADWVLVLDDTTAGYKPPGLK